MKRTIVLVLAAAVAGGLAGGAIGLAFAGGEDSASSTDGPASVAAVQPVSRTAQPAALTPESIYRRHGPAVVVITATQTQEVPPTFFTPPRREQVESLGSGFVIDKRGDIVTNDHVVQGGSGIRVGFNSGASYPATIVGADPSTDVAVVRVHAPPSALRPLTFDDSTQVEVGDPVYAIGNPFGLDRTMTAGIVSATGRDIQAPNGVTIPDAIQTDAPINHGNSGGPLLDRFGRVVGINAQIQGGTVNANVGVGFAIPSDTARTVARQLIEQGRATHAWLGVGVETIDPSVAAVIRGLPSHGLIVAQVLKGSPAANAGVKAATGRVTVNGVSVPIGGDVIAAVDGRPVTTSEELADAVARRRPGDHMRLELARAGTRRSVVVALGNAPSHG